MKTSRFIIRKEWYSKHFKGYLESNKEFNFLFGGRASSKSHTVFLKHFAETFQTEYRNIFFCRHEWDTIRRTTYKDMVAFLKITGLNEYFDYSASENGSMVFKNKITGWTLSPYGLSDIEAIKGLSQPTHIFVDEVDKCVPGVFGALVAVLRTPMVKVKQLTLMWNPVSEKSWLREYFFDESDKYKLKPEYDKVSYLNHSTFKNNDFLDHEEYGKKLILASNGSKWKLDVEYYGLWGNPVSDKLFLFAFNKDVHVPAQPIEYDKRYPLIVSCDWNVSNLVCTVWQYDVHFRFIHAIDEILLKDSDVYRMASEIKRRYDTNRMILTGDMAGNARSFAAVNSKSAIQIMREELKLGFNQVKFLKGKGSGYVNDKRTLGNHLLNRHPNLKISSRCAFLIEDIMSVEVTNDGKMDKKDVQRSHMLDTMLDFLMTLCKDAVKFTPK